MDNTSHKLGRVAEHHQLALRYTGQPCRVPSLYWSSSYLPSSASCSADTKLIEDPPDGADTKQAERSLIANSLRNLIPDILIAWAGAYASDSGILGFFGIIIGLQCIYFFIWLKTFLWSWLLFWTTGRKKMATLFEDFLYKNRFPQPPEYVGVIDDYFSQVANDSKMHPALRVKAAIELGTMAGIKTAGRHSMGMQLHLAYEDALEEFSRRFPPRDE